MSRAPQWNEAAENRNDRGEAEHYGQKNQSRRSGRAEHAGAEHARKSYTQNETDCASGDREHQLLRKKNASDQDVGRADGFHDANFRAPLKHRRSRSGRNGQRRCDQSRKRHDPQQRADVRQDFSFRIGHAANRPHVRARQNLRDLVTDRRNVRRAEPLVEFGGRQRGRIATGKRVGRLGQRADEKSSGNWPGWPESDCAIASGTSTALSSAPCASPVETIPVTTRGIDCDCP